MLIARQKLQMFLPTMDTHEEKNVELVAISELEGDPIKADATSYPLSLPRTPLVTFKSLLGRIHWAAVFAITITTLLSLYGLCTREISRNTAIFAYVYGIMGGLSITAGYHRLWAHRSYIASRPLEYALALIGAGAVQGPITWWARGHRAHHRYTDTDLDPYNANHGLLWSHIGWMLVNPRTKPGSADVSDLLNNPVVRFQRRWYYVLLIMFGFVIPSVIPGVLWGDFRGGFFFAGALRCCISHHITFCTNSLAHYFGTASYDDEHTPRDHLLTAIITGGEGYHNFHHQFPMDYRCGVKWHHYDPTKWVLAFFQLVGLASHLKVFPGNEIDKRRFSMRLKSLQKDQDCLKWPADPNELAMMDWESYRELAVERPLVVISGFIHDVSSFLDDHPGGRNLLSKHVGQDATTAFWGGVYNHSNTAHDLLAMMRVGILAGGMELEAARKKALPPSQRLRILDALENQPTPGKA